MDFFANLSIRTKILLITAVAIVGSITIVAVVLSSYRGIILEQKKLATRHVVETAIGVIEHYESAAKSGAIDLELAKQEALTKLRGMRYEGEAYFWVNDMHPTLIMHPKEPELEGKDMSDFKDSNGKRLFVEFVNTVKQSKSGFVNYMRPSHDSDKQIDKMSYVQGFEPWGWILGSGFDLDDVDKEFGSKASQTAIMVLVMLLTLIAVSSYVIRWITSALSFAVNVADTVASGDLTKQIDVKSDDEIGNMLQALKTMNEKLLTIVNDVRYSSDSISSTVKQVSASNNDLSQRTQSQACSLEETASAMHEMTSAVVANANSASKAFQLATGANSQAEIGSDIVSKANSAMSDINNSSKRISDIISMINEIAFQTNLLALNAAVEAARAGEHGRGFAVVANEIRDLARRSSSAAKEIKELISDSVEKIQLGSCLVNESGQALTEIVESAKKVTDILENIAATSQEQSVGIEQINKAIIQMEELTQQNAALVEEAAATSLSMERSADHMIEVVNFFKTDNTAHGNFTSTTSLPNENSTPKPTDGRKSAHTQRKSNSTSYDKEDQWEEF
jgi:methyl-accepting chemotaxis protein